MDVERSAASGNHVELLRRTLLARLFFILIQRDLFEVVSFEDVVAIQASHIVDPVTPHQKLRALMLTARHRMQIIPILMKVLTLSSPLRSLQSFTRRPVIL
jgi:hypothetical protein